MGGKLAKAVNKLFGNKPLRALMLGLDSAGKTTILYKMKLGQTASTIPTVGFNVETVTFKDVKFNVWDVGGQEKIRPLWRHYFSGTQALIFVIDSCDVERMEEARVEMMRILEDTEMESAILLVLANKMDLPNAISVEEIRERLLLSRYNRPYYIQPTCGLSGDGLIEGLEWLSVTLNEK